MVAAAFADTEGQDRVALGRLVAPPTIDGVLSPGEWEGAGRVELRYQVQPGDNAAPSERTEVFLAADAERLFLAFRAFDSDPAAVRARVGRRDDVFQDDYVSVYLDTFDDRRRAYVFHFNPLGIQADGLYNEGTAVGRNWAENVDASWDGVLVSKGALDSEGYVVEAAVPFATLRYQAGPGRAFGLHLARWISRKAESVYWRPISRDVSSLLVQMGQLTELDAIGRRRTLDLIPEVVGSVAEEGQPGGGEAKETDGEPGLTATWTVTPNLQPRGHGQPRLLADRGRRAPDRREPALPPLLSREAPLLPRGRPVLPLPGRAHVREHPADRRSGLGGEAGGKTGRNSLGVLASSDRAPGERAGTEANAVFGIARYQRDLFRNSTLGCVRHGAPLRRLFERGPRHRRPAPLPGAASSASSSRAPGPRKGRRGRGQARRPTCGTSGRDATFVSSSTTSG